AALALSLVALPLVARAAPPDTRPTVAVLYFDYSGKDADMAVLRKGLAQMLISDLSALDGVRLVERDRLEEILAELKLAQSGKIDPATAAKVGKLLGARYMVLGGYFDLMNTLRADARVVEVETGKVLQSTGASGKPQDFLGVEQKLSDSIAKILVEKTHPIAEATPTSAVAAKKPPKPPGKLATKLALRYSRALDAKDRGDKTTAKKELAAVVKEQPDFRLAQLDIDKLIQ
ncbi:MAG TPA: CsgG/HfaB family protein, partial [Polyangia bacterium]